MKFSYFTSLAISILLTVSVTHAAQTSCPEHFANGQAPDLISQKLTPKTRDVCYSGFALKHSGITRTPLYSAEHLTLERLSWAKGMKRTSKFYPDPNIPASERAELRHYARSGYDRGHVAPSADMPDERSQQECFSLANMVPQVPENNRGPWEAIESAVRKMTKDRGELYVVSGPIFRGNNLQRIGGTVIVPTQLFKAVYDPRRKEAAAYLIDNAEGAQPQMINIAELDEITGIDVFPFLNHPQKDRGMKLLEPMSYKERKGKRGR